MKRAGGLKSRKAGGDSILEWLLRAGLVMFCSFIYASFFSIARLLTSNDEGWGIEESKGVLEV